MKKKVFSIILLLCLCMTLLPTEAYADNSITRDEAVKWLYAQEGVWHDLDNAHGAQCSDLVSAYMNWLYSGYTNPYQGYGVYNASYYPTVAGWNTSRWAVYSNTSSFVPEPGDIYVQSAHVGVFLTGSKSRATVIDQNSWETWALANENADKGGAGRIYDTSISDSTYFIRYKNYSTASTAPTTPAVSFTPWDNASYTYVRETDAAIGQVINVSGGSCTETGMHLYDNSGNFLASAKNPSYTLPQVYFKINEECGYTLTPGTTYKYKFYAVVNGTTHWSNEGSFKTAGTAPVVAPTVTFNPWSNDNYTYLRETDAAIGQEILVSNGSCTETGMHLYDKNGNFLASAKNPSYTLARVYFKINEECGYTLTPGTNYKYKFYAVVNGTTYWGNEGSFTTVPSSAVTHSISLSPSSLDLTVGISAYISATVSPAGSDVTWSSSNDSVATVYDGMVMAVAPGTATITASVGDKSARCTVTVNENTVAIQSVTLNKSSLSLKAGESSTLTATVKPDNASDKTVSWSSSDPSVATVSGGRVSAVAPGTATITAKAGDKTAACVVTVTAAIPVSGTQESESNDTIVTANSISLNTKISGNIETSTDEDWFEFTLPSAGMIQISFGHEYVDNSGNCWRSHLYTSGNEKIGQTSWRGNAVNAERSAQIGLDAGTYYICVEAVLGKWRDVNYEFEVLFTASETWEKELDDTPVTAVNIGLGTEYHGAIMDSTDEDWFVFTLPAASSVQLTFGHEYVDTSGNCWRTYIYSEDDLKLSVENIAWAGKTTVTETSEDIQLNAGTYYVCVEAMIGRWDDATYWLSVQTNGGGKPTGDPATDGVHFERVDVYFQDQFSDVPANQWYTNNVADAFEFGLMKGNSATTFNPYGDVTIAEAVTMAARIHSIYTTGTESFRQSGDKWYQVYMDYAYENGIISQAYYNCDASQKATRAQFAEIFACSLPDAALPAISSVKDNAIPDVKMADRYAGFVYKLYRAGILTGSDSNGTFNPQTYITRAEAATIVARIAESDTRVVFSLS